MQLTSALELPHFTRYEGTAPGTTTLTISGHAHPLWWNPYEDVPTLKGLGDATDSTDYSPRWDLLLIGFGLSFASVFGYAYWKHRKR